MRVMDEPRRMDARDEELLEAYRAGMRGDADRFRHDADLAEAYRDGKNDAELKGNP